MWKALIKLVNKWACSHKWKEIYSSEEYAGPSSKNPHTIQKTLACERCGKITRIKT